MYHYIRIRRKGTGIWKAARENNRILVFDSYETARKYAQNLEDFAYSIIPLLHHPMHKKSRLYRRMHKKVGW